MHIKKILNQCDEALLALVFLCWGILVLLVSGLISSMLIAAIKSLSGQPTGLFVLAPFCLVWGFTLAAGIGAYHIGKTFLEYLKFKRDPKEPWIIREKEQHIAKR